ncbi:amidase family protein [Alphaproteobacteria bacterium]|nr:amidase family protein [Alphaproteobacteria bacterium]
MTYLVPHTPKNEIVTCNEGLLKDLNFVTKDMCDVKNYKTSCGNPDFYNKCKPAKDFAPFLKELLNKGAILKGITICDEFFYSVIGENTHYGTPTNLNAPNCVPGGSSSGSAAALTTNLYDFSIGSDTGGSVRVPASFCGLYGIRPTHGRIASAGVYPMAPSFDTIGWFANNIDVFKKIGHVLLNIKNATKESFKSLVVSQDLLELADESVQKLFNEYLKTYLPNLEKIQISKKNKDEIADYFRILQGGEIKKYVIPWIEKNSPKISPEINNRIKMASKITKIEINNAKKFRDNLILEVNISLPKGNIAIFPTTPFSAPLCGQSDTTLGVSRKKLMAMTSIAGMTSRPQISIPKLKDNTSPVGISLLGWKNSDEILLNKLTDI